MDIMKELILITVILFSSNLWSLVEDDVSYIEEYDLVKSDVRKKMDNWEVNPTKLDEDQYKFKGQTRNLIDWEHLDPYKWLDFNEWAIERKLKDENTSWRRRLRESTHSEVIGRVLKCVGVCVNYRGTKRVLAEYKTKILEGDEFVTEPNSHAWILLVDGSILKVSSKTSVTLNEINFSKTEILVMLRLNKGYINFQTRIIGEFKPVNRVESDLSFYPLALLKANREFYMIKDYRKFTKEERMEYSIEPNPGYLSQTQRLNEIAKKNNHLFDLRNTRFYIYTPNVSIEGANSTVDLFYEPNGQAVFQINDTLKNFNKEDSREQHKEISFRGYNNNEVMVPENGTWYEIDSKGKQALQLSTRLPEFDTTRQFLSRIPTIYLAREFWLQKYSSEILNLKLSSFELAESYGYRLWDEEQKNETIKRLKFVKEYVRRVETTNLYSLAKILKNKKLTGYDKSFFAKAMRTHYDAIRRRKDQVNILIREMSDTEFYLWAVKYGRN
jgi:hypothetical protein